MPTAPLKIYESVKPARRTRPGVTVVMPVLNEADQIIRRLRALKAHAFAEVILVDGGSQDETRAKIADFINAQTWGRLGRVVCLLSSPGRARQMNRGAAQAAGDVLLFLHADTLLPRDALSQIREAVRAGYEWGRFDIRLDGRQWIFRVIERLITLRSALSGIATGDQAIFVRRDIFHMLGGYAAIPLMEDIDLSRRLKSCGRPACLRVPVTTSARRWTVDGILPTIVRMWVLRFLYGLGVSPMRLARYYRPVR